jgi:hypothetical protein
MRVSTKTVLDIETGKVVFRETFEYFGPLALAISGGGTKSNQKSQQNSSQESGTRFNQDFLDQALAYFNPKRTTAGQFDAATYLKQNPDVAADPYWKNNAQMHYQQIGQGEGRQATMMPDEQAYTGPDYNPQYEKGQFTPGAFTGANYTPVDGGDFNKIESNMYEGNRAKLSQAYDANVARQREELSQSGALNSPSQFLEGSARSSLDRSYMENLQQAARDASSTALGLKANEAARRTGFDVGEATRRTGFDVGQGTERTAYDTGEAARKTGFNQDTQSKLIQLFLAKLQAALESGKYGQGQSSGYSTGNSSGANFGLFQFGGGSSS